MARKVFWCTKCNVPLFQSLCELCGTSSKKYMSCDLTPVFKEEMSLLRKQFDFIQLPKKSTDFYLWKNNSSYFRLGYKVATLSFKDKQKPGLIKYNINNKIYMNYNINKFNILTMLKANKSFLNKKEYKAQQFIIKSLSDFPEHKPIVSFSGGKDSTVISTLVQKTVGVSGALHVFLDTTLESNDTYKYIYEFTNSYPKVPIMIVKPSVNFFEMCNVIGPPSRLHRWCCTSHKAAPMGTFISLVTNKGGILNFDGIRAAESIQRAKRPQTTMSHTKIAQQISASIIYDWSDLEVWAYILKEGLLFNYAYRRGFNRVGCIYCPYTAGWAEYLNGIAYKSQHNKWKKVLYDCAVKANLNNPKEFSISTWKGRSKGKEFDKSSLIVNRQNCLLDDDTFVYSIPHEKMSEFSSYIAPLGKIHYISGDKNIKNYLMVKRSNNLYIAKITIDQINNTVRVSYNKLKGKFLLQKRFERQIRKLQSCTHCGACAALCAENAIRITNKFFIDSDKCVSCMRCISKDCVIVKALGS